MKNETFNIINKGITNKVKFYSSDGLIKHFNVRLDIYKFILGYIKCLHDLKLINDKEIKYLFIKACNFLSHK